MASAGLDIGIATKLARRPPSFATALAGWGKAPAVWIRSARCEGRERRGRCEIASSCVARFVSAWHVLSAGGYQQLAALLKVRPGSSRRALPTPFGIDWAIRPDGRKRPHIGRQKSR